MEIQTAYQQVSVDYTTVSTDGKTLPENTSTEGEGRGKFLWNADCQQLIAAILFWPFDGAPGTYEVA